MSSRGQVASTASHRVGASQSRPAELAHRDIFSGSLPDHGHAISGETPGMLRAIARESLTIAGWVAMWRPMQIYRYDCDRFGGSAGIISN